MSKTKNSKSTSIGSNEITTTEMVRIYKRIHKILSQRVRESKKEKGRDRKLLKKYVDSTKDLYAYVRIMDVCKSLSRDVNDLKEVLDTLVNKGKPN